LQFHYEHVISYETAKKLEHCLRIYRFWCCQLY